MEDNPGKYSYTFFKETVADSDKIPAIISPEMTVSYHRLGIMVALSAKRMAEEGFKPGQKVVILSQNSTAYLVLLLACWKYSLLPVLVSSRWPEAYTRSLLETVGCSPAVIPDSTPLPDLLDPAVSASAMLMVPSGYFDPDQEATVIFTSGSTSNPKAVVHTLGSHYFSALGSNRNIPVNPGDRWLLSLPLFHVGGMGICWRAFQGGGAVVIPEISQTLPDAIRSFHISHLSLVATQLYRLLQDKGIQPFLQKMKAILLGGGPIPDTLLKKAADLKLPVYVSYGSTEMASQVTTTAGDDPPSKWFTSGRVLPHRRVKIAPDGEILVKGETLFQGYLTRRGLEKPVDAEGWFHSGDMGTLDNKGYLTVRGRRDNMFVSGGENIQPEEIEAALRGIPGVQDAVVVPVTDPEFGQRPVAFLKMQDDKRQETRDKDQVRQEGESDYRGSARRKAQELRIKDQATSIQEPASSVRKRGVKYNIQKANYQFQEIADYVRKVLPGYKVPDLYLPWPEEGAAELKISRVELRERAEEIVKRAGG